MAAVIQAPLNLEDLDSVRDFVLRGETIPERTTQGLVPESLGIDAEMAALPYPEGTSYLSIAKVLCNEAGCLTAISPDLENDLTAWDYGHLTPSVARHVAAALFTPVAERIDKVQAGLNDVLANIKGQ